MTTTQDETLRLLLRQLDVTPDDRTLLLVIADRLEELGECGEGWRAIERHRLVPHFWNCDPAWGWVSEVKKYSWDDDCYLPVDWLLKLTGTFGDGNWACWWHGDKTCSVAFAIAANAFLQLPAERRTELLTRNGE